jgi:hypothetical protein
MIKVRIQWTDKSTGTSFIVAVTAPSIARALELVPGEVIFPIGEDFFVKEEAIA